MPQDADTDFEMRLDELTQRVDGLEKPEKDFWDMLQIAGSLTMPAVIALSVVFITTETERFQTTQQAELTKREQVANKRERMAAQERSDREFVREITTANGEQRDFLIDLARETVSAKIRPVLLRLSESKSVPVETRKAATSALAAIEGATFTVVFDSIDVRGDCDGSSEGEIFYTLYVNDAPVETVTEKEHVSRNDGDSIQLHVSGNASPDKDGYVSISARVEEADGYLTFGNDLGSVEAVRYQTKGRTWTRELGQLEFYEDSGCHMFVNYEIRAVSG